jgi:predicted dehydrogenase
MNSVPRIGVVGTGWWATQFHIPSLVEYEGAELVAFADVNGPNLNAAGSHFGIEALYGSGEEMFAAEDLDAVVIAVPHVYHYALVRAALEADLHVLIEKPMVLKASEGWDLVDLAANRNLHLIVGSTYQYTRHAQRCKEFVAGGEIGELLFVTGLFASMVESFYRGQVEDYRPVFDFPLTGPQPDTYADPAISGGGQGVTQVSHAAGLILGTSGARAIEVSSFMENRDLSVDLVDAFSFRLDNGAIGTIGSTGSLRPGQPQQQEFRYYGTEGFLLQDLMAGTVEIHRNGTDAVERLEPLTAEELYPAAEPSRRLADLAAGKDVLAAGGASGAAAVEFLEAAYLAAAENRTVAVSELLSD